MSKEYSVTFVSSINWECTARKKSCVTLPGSLLLSFLNYISYFNRILFISDRTKFRNASWLRERNSQKFLRHYLLILSFKRSTATIVDRKHQFCNSSSSSLRIFIFSKKKIHHLVFHFYDITENSFLFSSVPFNVNVVSCKHHINYLFLFSHCSKAFTDINRKFVPTISSQIQMIQILQYADSYHRHESVWKYDGTKLANYYHRYCYYY